jgi:hypothetical protein
MLCTPNHYLINSSGFPPEDNIRVSGGGPCLPSVEGPPLKMAITILHKGINSGTYTYEP